MAMKKAIKEEIGKPKRNLGKKEKLDKEQGNKNLFMNMECEKYV